ncbi:GAF and ANTAR domain-containing protein [Streptomyces sp. H27-D2]|uniref:GAF and ANTAR domain-containing protein n=1 Tax=Streptomyces sp. H27-D2 TaxID=3046304 RepID=UPI002DBA9F2E|nr:GAF and ANTAR domain-containing protein [Streptomyces sp. H27-D2]MEC4018652.1 GAF and ANTAR domain-containing protein [Streptomyces sp. H27-D2]
MSDALREQRLAKAFVDLADTLVGPFDVIDFLHSLTEHCVSLLEVPAAGVLLAAPEGQILDAAASDVRIRQLELDAVAWEESPCHECFRTGTALPDTDITTRAARQRWPHFTPRALDLGFNRIAAIPLRLREQVIGALTLFHDGSGGPLDLLRLNLGKALADVATIGIVSQRAMHDSQTLSAQLHDALSSRVIIEQAKGILAARREISVDEAFVLLRRHARSHRQLLTDIAREVAEDSADPALFHPAR